MRALFGFGAPKKAAINQRALELEDELFATVRGAQPGKLAPKNEEKLEEILQEIRSFGDRNAARNLKGEYKLLYTSRPIGPTGVVSAKNQALLFEDGSLSRKADLAVLGVTVGTVVSTGDVKFTGSSGFKVVYEERVVDGLGENLIPKMPEPDSRPVFEYSFYYLGASAFVAYANVSTSDKEPALLVFKKAGVKPAPQPAESDAPPKREGRAGRATLAEREYKERSKAAAAPAAKEEEAKEKKSSASNGGLFGGFFAPPRYIDEEEGEEEEDGAAPAPKGRGRAAPVKSRGKPAPAKGKVDAKAQAAAAKQEAAAAKREAEAAKRKEAAEKREVEAAKRKEEAERKAAEVAAKKEQAAAERAAAQQKKQEIQEFLKQLAADVKAAQAESKNAIQSFRDASRENASLLKESTAAKELIEKAEASILEAVEEVEELSSAEKKAANDLREAQKQLQKLSK